MENRRNGFGKANRKKHLSRSASKALSPRAILSFFEARDSDGVGLWVSDGTTAGTRFLTTQSGVPDVAGDLVFYWTSNGLWRSDGTPEGTERIFNRSNSPRVRWWTTSGDKVFFAVGKQREGFALWQSDGTLEGTKRVSSSQDVSQLREFNGQVYFTQPHDDFGQELWRTDGTPEGTQLIDIAPGPDSSNPWVMSSNDHKTLFWSTVRESRGLWALSHDSTQPTRINETISGPSEGTEFITSTGIQRPGANPSWGSVVATRRKRLDADRIWTCSTARHCT